MINFCILLDKVAMNLVTADNSVFRAKAHLDFRQKQTNDKNSIFRMILYNYYEL